MMDVLFMRCYPAIWLVAIYHAVNEDDYCYVRYLGHDLPEENWLFCFGVVSLIDNGGVNMGEPCVWLWWLQAPEEVCRELIVIRNFFLKL